MFDRNLPYFVNLYLPRSCLVLVPYNKTNIPYLFLFNIEIIHPRKYNIQLHFASLNINYFVWIISDGKLKGMGYLLIINILTKHNMNMWDNVSMREKCLNMDLKKLLIWTLPTQCSFFRTYSFSEWRPSKIFGRKPLKNFTWSYSYSVNLRIQSKCGKIPHLDNFYAVQLWKHQNSA